MEGQWKWPQPDDFANRVGETLHVSHFGELLNISATGPDPKAEMLTVRTVVRSIWAAFPGAEGRSRPTTE